MDFSLPATFAVLERTPALLTDLLGGLPEPWLSGHEGQGTWSPHVVLGHLVHGEQHDWIPRARMLLEQGERATFPPFDRFAQLNEPSRSTTKLLRAFARLREQSLESLRGWNLSDDDLVRTGTHPEFGAVSLSQLLATWTVHDLAHTAQICRVMCHQYDVAVGPWKEFLPILVPRV